MTRREYKGGAAQVVLNGNINASGVTTINTTGTVTGWPTGGTGKFLIVIDKGNAGEEKVYCSSRTGNALTVASDADRGADGTSAASHVSGVTINHCGGAIDLDEPNAHINLTAQDDHTQYLNTTRHDITARHVFGGAYGTPGVPTDVDPAVVGSVGAAGGPGHSDHTHGLVTTMPRGTVGVTTVTANYSLTTSTSDVPGLAVTFTAITGRRYRVAVFAGLSLNVSTAATLSLQEGATVLAKWDGSNSSAGSGFNDTATIVLPLTAASGSHTLKVTGIYVTSGGGGAAVLASSTNPASILVEDIGT